MEWRKTRQWPHSQEVIKQLDMNHLCRAITATCFESNLFQLREKLQIQRAIFMLMSSV